MALTDPYVSLPELKEYTSIPDNVDDAVLEQVTRAVTRQASRYARRNFNDAGTVSARVYNVYDPWYLRVDDFSTVTGLIVKTDLGNNGTYSTTIANANVTPYPLNGIRDGVPGFPFNELRMSRTQPMWPVWMPNPVGPLVQVTAQWGWAAVPPEVKQACLIQCANVFGRRYSPGGLAGQGDFVFRVSTLPLDPTASALLDPFRNDQVVIV